VRVSTANIWRSSYISSQIFYNSQCQPIVVDHNAACIDTPFEECEDDPAHLDIPVTPPRNIVLLDFTPPPQERGETWCMEAIAAGKAAAAAKAATQQQCCWAKKRKGAPKSAPTGDEKGKKKKKMESENELKAIEGEEDWEPEDRSQ
jgi:hypothetical protein